MLTAKDAVQREKDQLFSEIRHACNKCTCPSNISVSDLDIILQLLKGEDHGLQA